MVFLGAMSSWTYLFLAGLLEMGFTTCLKLSEGFSRPQYIAGFLFFAALSFYCLSRSLATIPLGTAYAVWTGIGAGGTAILGIFFFDEPRNLARLLFLFLLIASIVGLKLFAADRA